MAVKTMAVFEAIAEFVIALVIVFVVSIPTYVIYHRKYFDWIDNLLICHKNEKPLVRFVKLFIAYFPLASLVSFGIFITEVGWTLTINFFDLAVFFSSACIILFLVRAVATAPLLKERPTSPPDVIQHLVGFVWVGAIIGTVKLALLFAFNPTTYTQLIAPLYTPQIWTITPMNIIIWLSTTIVTPLLIVTVPLELLLFSYCKHNSVERLWKEKDDDKSIKIQKASSSSTLASEPI